MKKRLITALCASLAVAMALPAFAVDTKVNGYFRARAIMADIAQGKDETPDKLVDQRFRAKVTMSLNEYVSLVYYGEVDFQYGDSSYGRAGATRNEGGGLGGDTANIETKNLYAAVKIPDTPLALKVGLMGYMDSQDGILFAADMAGVRLDAKLDMVDLTFGWHKWKEGAYDKEDDIDLWSVKAHMKMGDAGKVTGTYYYLNVQEPANFGTNVLVPAPKGDYHYISVGGTYKLPVVALSGWFLYNTGTADNAADNGDDVDVNGWGATVRGDFTVQNVKAYARLMYFSGDDDDTDTDYNAIVLPAAVADAFPFYKDGLMIMLADVMGNTYFQNGYAYDDGIRAGYGLIGGVVGANLTVQQFYVKPAFGYFATLEDDHKSAGTKKEGKNLGMELALRVGTKIADAVDVSINGAYAWLGDYYDKSVNGDDPDGQYETYVMVNIPY